MAKTLQLWEVDPFFAVAEEVQNSADRMESALRSWRHIRALAEASPYDVPSCNIIDSFERDLLTTLDTVKWQLQEFERAVMVAAATEKVYLGEDAPSRHHQFVTAIRSQITSAEHVLKDASCPQVSGAIHLNIKDDETDSFAQFLSGQKFCGKRVDNGTNAHCNSMENQLLRKEISCRFLTQMDSVVDRDLTNVEPVVYRSEYEPAKINTEEDSFTSQGQLEIYQDKREEGNKLLREKQKHFKESVGYPYAIHGEVIEKLVTGHRMSSTSGTTLENRIPEIMKTDVNSFVGSDASEKPVDGLSIWRFCTGMKNAAKLQISSNGFKRWKDGDAGRRDESQGGDICVVVNGGINSLERGWVSKWPASHRKMAIEHISSESNFADEKLCNGWKTVQCHSQPTWKAISASRMVQIVSAILIVLCLVGMHLLSYYLTFKSDDTMV
ncbi:hypothetical protein O6H91_15G080100 [Diphasiastrum complanatum]|uniref:Uncharacterized protein n=1 Tax=Diphasiastrum complanatum TaxID=34168 RepID=A0ACC2BK32_DIPCM|nr:hypothetical protein O6H91_15G080100 [Diphasiastrum complanatum]